VADNPVPVGIDMSGLDGMDELSLGMLMPVIGEVLP
jgi:hypothetical protein